MKVPALCDSNNWSQNLTIMLPYKFLEIITVTEGCRVRIFGDAKLEEFIEKSLTLEGLIQLIHDQCFLFSVINIDLLLMNNNKVLLRKTQAAGDLAMFTLAIKHFINLLPNSY